MLDSSATPGAATHDPLRPEGERLTAQRHWHRTEEIALPDGIGGGAILLEDLFRRDLGPSDDPLGRAADHRDGLHTIAAGIAANRSLTTGPPVIVDEPGLEQLG